MAELANRERTQQHIEHLRETEGRLSRKTASLEREFAVLTERVDHVRLQVTEGFAMLAVEGRLRQITDIVSALQSNAYGERGSVSAASNLLLAGNQLFWTLLDPVLKESGMLTKSGSSTLSLLTPIGSFLTGQLLLANRQHERFLSGVATVDANGVAHDTLRSRIAAGEWEAFQRRTDVPVTLYVVDGPPPVPPGAILFVGAPAAFLAQAKVRDGVLNIRIFPPTAGVRVAWMVDTGIGHG